MTTATGDYAINFRPLPDDPDYENSDLVFLLGGAQIEDGLLNSSYSVSGRLMWFNNTTSFSTSKISVIEKNSPSTAGGESGPAHYDASGNGYELKAVYDELRIYKVTGASTREAIGGQVNLDYDADTDFSLQINEDGSFIGYANGADVGFGIVIDNTWDPATLKPGGYSDRDSGGGGWQSGVFSFAASSIGATPQISSINDGNPVIAGESGGAVIINMAPVSLTIGGIETQNFTSLGDDSYSFDMPFFIDGAVYPEFDEVEAQASSADDTPVTATLATLLDLPDGWAETFVTSLSDDPDSLYSAVSGLTIKEGNKLYSQVSEITLYGDTTFSGAAPGTVYVWNRDVDNNTMTLIRVVNGSVQPVDQDAFARKIKAIKINSISVRAVKVA